MNKTSFNYLPAIRIPNTQQIKALRRLFIFLCLSIIPVIFSSCAPGKFASEEKEKTAKPEVVSFESVPVRILLEDVGNDLSFSVASSMKVLSDQKALAYVNKGNRIEIASAGSGLKMNIGGQMFSAPEFRFTSAEDDNTFEFDGKKYRGTIVVNSNKKVVNVVSLEDYLKGVLPAEMPAGKGNENFEALKAQAVCARTYTVMKLNEKKKDFDLYIDVRDQVYGGAASEKEITNKAIEATRGLILGYKGAPAVVFYSASCGGHTEEGTNVFVSAKNTPYLVSVKDGDEPYCSITPKFEWEEKYNEQGFIGRFKKNGLLNPGSYSVKSIDVISRFESGRVNELRMIFLKDNGVEVPVSIYGNQIRSIIRTADDKGILRSTMFDIKYNGEEVIISGRGNGHGVGLCQWGAIAMSRKGKKFDEILKHYFPGTELIRVKK
jgi:stage II sporulation protein D